MKKRVKKVFQWMDDKLEVFIGAVFLALMVVFTTLQIVGRYLFSTPFPWTEEMTRYMFVWMVFISIGYAVKTGEHIRITFVRSLLRPSLRLYLDIVCNILCFGFSVICMIEGYKLLSIIRQGGQTAVSLPIPMWLLYLVMPLGFLLVCLRLVQCTVKIVEQIRQGGIGADKIEEDKGGA
ncbi:MAG: TRAP transporter small permease [Clostridia bacterium]|nr:TRAP transporter small permease [Clostridia bacterium]